MAADAVAVVDASVLGAAFFNEEDSERARVYLAAGPGLVAPDLLFAEVASIAAKKVWRGEAPEEAGRRALAALPEFISEFVDSAALAPHALRFAAEHRISAYDGIYIALAEAMSLPLISLDARLANRLAGTSLAERVEMLKV